MSYQFNEKEHLHTLNGKPLTGTSSVGDVLFKPLSWWASGKACEKLGWKHPKHNSEEDRIVSASETLGIIKDLDVKSYLAILDNAYRAHADYVKDAADKGIDLHSELEDYVRFKMGKTEEREWNEKITPFIEWTNENVQEFLWSEAHTYSEELWLGGISDAGAILKDKSVAVIDFKSAKDAYPTMFIQACLYAMQIEETGLWSSDGKHNKKVEHKINKLIIFPFGAKVVEAHIRDTEMYRRGAECAVELYRLLGLEKQNNG